ncbi:uncharacterized protein [Anoplolepis gracilipes]|uniref:uncharacterized protein n=1 Tax=Anoplolepis gracilipes TaxID=354296 RepID=UPI003BA180FA
MSQDARVVVIEYPVPARVHCPRCWMTADGVAKSRGEFSDPPHLIKHQKKYHAGDTVTYKCSMCEYMGQGRYPLKSVKVHFEKSHGVPAAAGGNADGAHTGNTAGGPSSSGARPRAVCAAPPSTSAAGAPSRNRASSSRQPRLTFSASAPTPAQTTTGMSTRATPPATTTSAPTRRSPSYAAVTAAGPTTNPPSSSAAANTTRTTSTALTGRTTAITCTASAAPRAAAAGTIKAHPQPQGGSTTQRGAANRKRPSPASREARIPTPTSSGGGPATTRRPSVTPPTTTSTTGSSRSRRSQSVPLEKSGATRPTRVPPRRSPGAAADFSPSFGGGGGTRRRTPEKTPPTIIQAGPTTRSRTRASSVSVEKTARETRSLARSSARAAPRAPPGRTTSTRRNPEARPATTISAGTAVRNLSAALSTSRSTGRAQGPARTSPLQRGTPPSQRSPAASPTICVCGAGSPQPPPTSEMPATSMPATLSTNTVTTTTCGSPVMSTGYTAGRRSTPLRPSPLPTILEVSPCEVDVRMRRDMRTPDEVHRGASPRTSGEEGDPERWRTSLGRRARRRRSDDSVQSVSPAAAGPRRSPVSPITPANISDRDTLNLIRPCSVVLERTSVRSVERVPAGLAAIVASRRINAGGAPGQRRAEEEAAGHPSGSASVRGVMGRRRGATVAGGAGANGMTPPSRALNGGGEHRRGPRRALGPAGQRPADLPTPAAAARQYRRARLVVRDVLMRRAGGVASLADLEEYAASVADFLGGGAAGVASGGAPGARDRPVRSREARGRRGGGAAPARDDARNQRGPAPAGPSQSGEGRGDWVREATRLQALYRVNRRRAVREVLQGPAEFCQVPKERVQAYFEDLYRGGDPMGSVDDEVVERADPLAVEEAARLLDPFAERIVDRRLRRMNNSAPGPDGISYKDLRESDPGARLLTALFNICQRLEAVPASWKTSNTVLVYKKGNREMLENWRPLALGDTVPKLYAALVADRLTDWAVSNNKLSRAQKGFLRDEGCYEHNFVLQEILTDARRTRRQAVVAWLDLSNAFGSIPHATIRRALIRSGVPGGLVNIWNSMYDGCSTRVRAAEGYTAPVPIRSGVRQGCPLSPVVFDLAIDSVLRAVTDVDAGFDLLGYRFNTFAYADDIALVAETPEGMRRLLAVAELEASSVGLRFNPAKCATLHIGAGVVGRVLPTTFEIQGQPVRHLADGGPYFHLGVPTGFSVDQTPYVTIGGLLEDLRAVDRALLAPWQKIETLATNILPRVDFLLRGAAVEKRPLKTVDLEIRRAAKDWLNLPQRASAEVVYLPPKRGGCGLLPMSDLADVLSVAHAFRMLTAGDETVRGLAWASLRGVVARRIGGPPSGEDLAAFLSGSLEGRLRDGGERSLWSRARNAARRQSERLSLRWRWSGPTEELVVECRGTPIGDTVKIPPGARAQVVTRLRSAVAAFYASALLAKPDQGKVFEVSSRAGVSNHFVRGGSFTRFADWRFIHRARLDVLPLNGARRWGEADRRCRRCGLAAETLPHVINHCGVHSAAIQLRHDAVLHRLRKACRMPGEKRVNQRVEGVDGELGELRPDLVIRHEPSKCVVICDVTVPFENRWRSFEEARARKIAKYSPLAEALQREGYRVVVTAFVVGSLGSWDPANEAVLRTLHIGSAYASMLRRLVVSDTIRWSRDVYVEHVSGVRQYAAPSRPSGDGVLATPPRAVRRRWPAGRNGGVA